MASARARNCSSLKRILSHITLYFAASSALKRSFSPTMAVSRRMGGNIYVASCMGVPSDSAIS